MAANRPTSARLAELAALHALGALSDREQREYARLRKRTAGAALEKSVVFRHLPHALAAALPPAAPPAGLKARVLADIAARIKRADEIPHARRGFESLRQSEAGWMDMPIPGVRMKVLTRNEAVGYTVVLARLAAGATFPEHDHAGPEELFILSGDLQAEGRLLQAGDFHHADPGTHHEPLFSAHGCEALLVLSTKDFK